MNPAALMIEYVRDGLTYEAEIVPAESTYYVSSYSCGAENVKASGLSLLKYSFLEVKSQIRTTIQSLKGLLTGGLGVKDMSGPVGVVEHDERGRLAFDEGGFQNVLRVFDGIAGVHRGVVGHVVLQQPAESPLTHLVQAAWR